MYRTQCTACQGPLYIVGGSFSTEIRIFEDGFSTEDAKFFDTTDEIVKCLDCEKDHSANFILPD